MQIPILNGIFTDNDPSVRVKYPVNLMPVAQSSGVSSGYLRPADGIVQNGTGPGTTRGGINWNDVLYRVMGSKLVSIASNGTVTTLGDVGNDSQNVTFSYSFDRLAIASNGNLFYWDGSTLTQVTDPDLGTVVDQKWIDGYFLTTDGESLIVTDLDDPTVVNPLKFGSSEIDPDPVVAILKLRNEAYALNRYTIEVFDNVGGDFFPLQRKKGAQIQKGCVGTHACCVYQETIAFVGSSLNEQNSVYLGVNGVANKVSTREIDEILEGYTETELSTIKLEARNDRSSQLLYIHLPDQTLVYDYATSQELGQPVWCILKSTAEYRAKHMVYVYNDWHVGDTDSANIGTLSATIGSHWGNIVNWEFGTMMVYNESKGGIFHKLELVSLTGVTALGEEPRISTSYSYDGKSWSNDKYISSGKIGNTSQRLVWFRQGKMRNFRMQRFRGDSKTHASFMRLEAELEPLYV
jgi:hypothetical protein